MRPVSMRYYSKYYTLREIYKLELCNMKVIMTRNGLKPQFKKFSKKLGIFSLEKK